MDEMTTGLVAAGEPIPKLNEFQQEVNDSMEQCWAAAQSGRGRVLGQREVFLMAAYISGITEALMGLENRVNSNVNMLAAYMEEYGQDLFDTLTADVEAEVVDQEYEGQITIQEAIEEAEVVDPANAESGEVFNDTVTEKDGRDTEGSGLDHIPYR